MRKLLVIAVPLVMLLAGCTTPLPQPTPSATASPSASVSASAQPSQPPSEVSSPPTVSTSEPAETPELGGDDEPGRYAYRCGSLDASPEVQLSSLAEVWAATNYTRMASCDVSYEGGQPFEPTSAEEQAISTVTPGARPEEGLAVMLEVLRLCTRVSDETGPGGFKEAGHEALVAAAAFCPDAPQAKIIKGWADGTRTGAPQQ
ncbi:hypothetical protein [Paenarthrobacter nitroguajacolicus]|uniref:hypothetical protein n=1 Tax=Paenarthrobacter nitroguajacolicus TaxID=211146 RepID=UPI00248D21B3|nr:hypothetical protein [Paenarthrobacter nitroguajacolicus]MDI2035014.1 hypothetical protein [Paenarthrobacter nitroguajacolicus]